MNKRLKYIVFLSAFTLLVNCSFDKKTGIWDGGEEEQKRISDLEKKQKEIIDIVKVYTSEQAQLSEIKATKIVTLTKAKKNSSWKTSNQNVQNFIGNKYFSGINKNFLKKKIGKNKYEISKIISSPLIYDNAIYLSDDAGTIFKLDQKGKLYWKKNIYKKIYKKIYKNLSLSIKNDKIYVADNIGFIYSIDLENGSLVWIKNHGIPIKSRIKVFKDRIFFINQDNRIVCFDTKEGSLIWDVRAISSFIKSQNFLSLAISNQGDVFALASSGDLIKINSSTGRVEWALNIASTMSSIETDFFKSSEIVATKKEIIFSALSSTYSFNLESGYLNWQKEINTSSTPIIDGNNIFLVSNDGYFLNLDKNSGEIIWSTNILKILKKKKRNTKIGGFVLGSNKIYITTNNGFIIVCSANSGEVESFKKIGGEFFNAPIIVNGSLYLLTDKPTILGFN
tara:strand:- start:447 stop:1799 length:1353 start_codon:yes stop_codon:yes gene_type:complete